MNGDVRGRCGLKFETQLDQVQGPHGDASAKRS
jgi:hypothetical protein